MLDQIDHGEYSGLEHVFATLPRTAVGGTLAGLTPGRVYVDDTHDPRAAFTWSEFRFSYLAGNPADESFAQRLVALLESELLPSLRGSHDPTVVLYPDSPAWIDVLEDRLAAYHPLRLLRSLHRFDRRSFDGQAADLDMPPGFTLLPIDAKICARYPELACAYELLWGGVENFLAHGFGYCILAKVELASACDTAFCSGGRAEMGVETKETYRRWGLARLAATAFIRECLERELEPVWECWWENAASRNLATCLGFEWREDYPVLFIEMEG